MELNLRLFSIPISIKPTFLILGLLFYGWTSHVGVAAELVTWAFIAILLHELGHAWAFRRYGISPAIELYMLGGLTFPTRDSRRPTLTHGQQVFISFAGPLMSLLLGVVLLLLSAMLGGLPSFFMPWEQAAVYPLFFSIGWGVLNLLPILPLDGGHILRHLLAFNPRWNAPLIAAWVGMILGAALLAYTLLNEQWWNSMLVAMLLSTNYQQMRMASGKEVMSSTLDPTDRIREHLMKGKNEDALKEALNLLKQTSNRDLQGWAMQIIGNIYLQQNNLEAARGFAETYPGYHQHIPELKLALLLQDDQNEEAMAYAQRAYALNPRPGVAQIYLQLLVNAGRFAEMDAFLERVRELREQPEDELAFAAQLFYQLGHYEKALALETELHERVPDNPIFAYNAACISARLGRHTAGLDWLRKALALGYDDEERLQSDPDLASLRELPTFAEVVEQGLGQK
ncbi:MAG: hypothetical protein D6722_25715 [Bacteroidetes bacterium]|nr:MAG: hypothetical protein D6722_25715 [Bacteroidota bacterium]